jgi:hypothetical protein
VSDLGRLISRSCTTGWADWVHGELWLLPTALVRRRLSLADSKANGLGRTVPEPFPTLLAAEVDHSQVLTAHRTNKVIVFDDVVSGTLFRGRTAHGLKLVMANGQRHKLLWLVRDPAFDVLAEVLPGRSVNG